MPKKHNSVKPKDCHFACVCKKAMQCRKGNIYMKKGTNLCSMRDFMDKESFVYKMNKALIPYWEQE